MKTALTEVDIYFIIKIDLDKINFENDGNLDNYL